MRGEFIVIDFPDSSLLAIWGYIIWTFPLLQLKVISSCNYLRDNLACSRLAEAVWESADLQAYSRYEIGEFKKYDSIYLRDVLKGYCKPNARINNSCMYSLTYMSSCKWFSFWIVFQNVPTSQPIWSSFLINFFWTVWLQYEFLSLLHTNTIFYNKFAKDLTLSLSQPTIIQLRSCSRIIDSLFSHGNWLHFKILWCQGLEFISKTKNSTTGQDGVVINSNLGPNSSSKVIEPRETKIAF